MLLGVDLGEGVDRQDLGLSSLRNGLDCGDIGKGADAVGAGLAGDFDQGPLAYLFAVVPPEFRRAAQPGSEELHKVGLRATGDAELEALDQVGLFIRGAKAEEEPRNIARLQDGRVVEIRPLDAELVIDIQAGRNMSSCWCECFDLEARVGLVGYFSHSDVACGWIMSPRAFMHLGRLLGEA